MIFFHFFFIYHTFSTKVFQFQYIQSVIMLKFCAMFLVFWTFVQPNPIPDSSLAQVSSPNDLNGLLNVICSSHLFTNGLIEKDSSSLDQFNLWRRETSICRTRSAGSSASKKPKVEEPNHVSTTEPVKNLCPDESKQNRFVPLTCGGPEVWVNPYGTEYIYLVGNCEPGEYRFLFNPNPI